MEGFESYEYTAETGSHKYEFDSDGPNGKIRKSILFICVARDVYFISFGDVDPVTKKINDKAISNNSDTAKVFFTLAKIILEFTDLFPDARLGFTGSTKSRTRLYQMMINKYRHLIQTLFVIVGCLNNEEETFISGRNYDFITFYRKK